jgi:iron complex outermembrane receptor protein
MQFKLKPIAAVLMFVVAGGVSVSAQAVEVAAGDLEAALSGLAKETGIQILFDANALKGAKTAGVHNAATHEEALKQLLKGTNYIYSPSSSGTYVIKALPPTEKVTEMSPIEVRGATRNYTVRNTSAGSRTNTPIEQIPQSIVVVPKAMIEDQGVTTLSDALRNVSNVNAIDERDANNATFKIRGFNSATVVDGIAMPGYYPDQESLVGIERIDVIKGPAGALFGSAQGTGSAGAVGGGTIAISTVKASADAAIRKVGLRVGSFSEKAANFDLNQPLSSVFAIRLAGEVSDKKSESNGIFFKKTALLPSLSWTPDADTEVVLRGRYLDSTTLDYSGLPPRGTVVNAPYTLPRSLNVTARGLPDTINRAQGVNLQWNQHLNDAWKFSFVAAYNEALSDQRGVFPFPFSGAGPSYYLAGARMWAKFKTTTLSPSLTANFETGTAKHTVNFGVDYEKTKDDEFMKYPPGMGYLSFTPVNYTSPAFPAWIEPVAPAVPDMRNSYTSSVAYVQDQIDVGGLHLLGGVRHSRIDVTDLYPAMGVNNVSSNTRNTPRVGATYEFTRQISTFAGYSEGIKVPILAKFATPPRPEESRQTEVGLRLKDLAGISATLAWFELTRKNAAVGDTANPGFSIQTGLQQSRGVDLDLRWQATSALSLIAALTSQTASIIQDTNAAIVNKQLFNVPKQTARFAGHYDVYGGEWAGLGFGLGMTHHSSLPGNTTNTFFTPSATIADAQVSYKLHDMKLGLNVSNLFNKKYYMPSAYFGGGQVIPALPRTVSATANFSF